MAALVVPIGASAQRANVPHVLVISDGQAMTRINYPSSDACERARRKVLADTAPPPNTQDRIYGPSTVKAFCVPR